ncbi:Yorkie-like protein [Aphelenchoides fujianensis]|nr:Yorkie-like protein [Aphelenchoides fujianensis]
MASAKKRIEMVKQQKQSSVQINTSVDDPQKSIDELINAGTRTFEQRSKHFERHKSKVSFPLSYHNYPRSNPKSRGSSVGHSREGSSDDGFGSSGRQTLSPSSISSSNIGAQNFNANYTQPSNVVHQRQASAPELINHSPMHHHHLPPHHPREGACTRGIRRPAARRLLLPLQVALDGRPRLPPARPVRRQPAAGRRSGPPSRPRYHHQRTAKSCDFDAAGSNNAHNDVAMRSECIEQQQQTAGGSMHQMNAYNSPPAAHYWDGQQPRAKSQSLDPLSISLAPQSSGNAAPVHPHTSGAMGGHHHSLSAIPTHSGLGDDGLGPLPAGWAKDCTETGAVYFIDHNNKTTTWNDPRLAHETQPDHMRMRQSFGRMKSNSGGAISFPSANGGVYGGSPQLPSLSNQYGMHQGMDLVQQLKMERTSMAERQQQLQQQGLLDQQQQSPHQTQAAQQFGSPPCHLPQPPQSSPYNPPHLNSNGGYPMQHAPMPMEMYGSPDFAQPRSSANESMDNTMEVDFQNGMQHSLFDPALVEDTAGINPHEFDKYLRINEGQRQSTTAAKYQM